MRGFGGDERSMRKGCEEQGSLSLDVTLMLKSVCKRFGFREIASDCMSKFDFLSRSV